MSYRYVNERGEELGFSLKPPKWLRKAQPGKILQKAALPLAAVGAALLIPGVGAAVGGGLLKAGGLFGRAIKAGVGPAARLLNKGGKGAARLVIPELTRNVKWPPVLSPGVLSPVVPVVPVVSPVVSMVPEVPAVPSGPGASPFAPAYGGGGGGGGGGDLGPGATAAAGPGELPSWALPAAIGVGLLLFMKHKK